MKPNDSLSLYSNGRHYDAMCDCLIDDIPFYREMVAQYGDPVLEIACGTGRITIPLAQNGISITGLDVSEPMLRFARQKAASIPVIIDFHYADCRDFHLTQRFNLIFIPFNSISHLHDHESLALFFRNVRMHLYRYGRFIIDMFVPRFEFLMRDPNTHFPVAEYSDPEGHGHIAVTETSRYDHATQINHLKWYYSSSERREPTVVENNMRIFYPQELELLLHYHGFEIEQKYGNYDLTPFTSDSPKQIIVCRSVAGEA